MRWRDWQPFTLLSLALVILALTTARFIAPALPAGWRPAAWLPIGAGVMALGFYGWDLSLRSARRARVERGKQQRRRAAEDQALGDVRARLQQIHVAFASETLRQAADGLRVALRREPLGPGARALWSRLLAIEGPGSDAWLGLARAWLVQGQVEPGLRCAAEAARLRVAGLADLAAMAHDALADEADLEAGLERGDPAAAVLAATQAERLSAPALGSLYRVLDGVLLPPALRLALWNIVFQRVSDTEEAARRREQRRANWDDPDLRRWLREGLAGYGPGTSVAPDDELPQPWLVLVPPRWYAALGFGPHVDALKPVRHSAALPIYAVADHDDLGPMADALVELAAEPVDGRMGGDQSPQLLARQLRRRLWPRAVRCRAALGEAIALLAEMRSPAHAAAGLEIVGRALGEETDRRLLDLREELERAARALAPDVCGAQALQAAGQAYAPTNPQRALELWDEAARLARKQEPGARRELLGRFVLDWLDLVEDPAAHGVEGPLLTMSAETALEAGDPEVLLETLLSVSARPAGRLREALLKRLGEREALLDPRGRFLLAWVRDDRAARLEAAQALWAHPGFGDEDWAWTALALASRVRYGDEPLLRRAMVALRLQAKCGQPEALAGWLACAYASDRLDERESRPEACRALEAVMALTGERLRLPLIALQSTCATPDPRWLAEVETVLMKRLHDIERAAHTRHDELAAIESVACVLYPAHIAAHLEVWWRQYQGTWA